MNRLKPTPVFVQSTTELKQKESSLCSAQYISFVCEDCGKSAKRKLKNFRLRGYFLKCSNCLSKQTCTNRYGVPFSFQHEDSKEKTKQTWLKKYGVENPRQSSYIKEKARQTCLKKYGVENQNQSRVIKAAKKQTCLEKYGVETPLQNKTCREKGKKTLMKRYGVDHPSKAIEVKEKIRQTLISHYGIPHPPSNCCKYKNISFDSRWELAVWIWANDLGKNIKREPVEFKYMYGGKERSYFPDFEIDGQLVEVKGDQFFKEGKMINPFNPDQDGLFEAKHQCGLRHGVIFWKENEMTPILQYIDETYGENYLQQFTKSKNNSPLYII